MKSLPNHHKNGHIFRQLKHKMAAKLATPANSGCLQFIKIYTQQTLVLCTKISYSVQCCILSKLCTLPWTYSFCRDNKTLKSTTNLNQSYWSYLRMFLSFLNVMKGLFKYLFLYCSYQIYVCLLWTGTCMFNFSHIIHTMHDIYNHLFCVDRHRTIHFSKIYCPDVTEIFRNNNVTGVIIWK